MVSAKWKWTVCGLLLLATMLNYMDRQILAQTATDIKAELRLTNEQYGELEMGFGLAFAAGAVIFGLLVDRTSVRWLYPAILLSWSLAGSSTAYADQIGSHLAALFTPFLGPPAQWLGEPAASGQAFLGLMSCRILLGLFEAGQWPCALVTTQRILSRKDRSFGNSLLQSGASVGAIFTPLVIQAMVTDAPGSWRGPFVAIGLTGMLWVVPWLMLIRKSDLEPVKDEPGSRPRDLSAEERTEGLRTFWRRFAALVVVVIVINLTWHYFRVWLPTLMREFHGYDRKAVNYFSSAYYIATDVGCLTVGFLVKYLADRGRDVHSVRLLTFFGCSLLTSLAAVAAFTPRGPMLLGLFLVVGFGALGLFPNYYAFSQDLSARHQGKVTGSLAAITWIVTSIMQKYIGRWVDETHLYSTGIVLAGLAPLAGCVALVLLWNHSKKQGIP